MHNLLRTDEWAVDGSFGNAQKAVGIIAAAGFPKAFKYTRVSKVFDYPANVPSPSPEPVLQVRRCCNRPRAVSKLRPHREQRLMPSNSSSLVYFRRIFEW